MSGVLFAVYFPVALFLSCLLGLAIYVICLNKRSMRLQDIIDRKERLEKRREQRLLHCQKLSGEAALGRSRYADRLRRVRGRRKA